MVWETQGEQVFQLEGHHAGRAMLQTKSEVSPLKNSLSPGEGSIPSPELSSLLLSESPYVCFIYNIYGFLLYLAEEIRKSTSPSYQKWKLPFFFFKANSSDSLHQILILSIPSYNNLMPE